MNNSPYDSPYEDGVCSSCAAEMVDEFNRCPYCLCRCELTAKTCYTDEDCYCDRCEKPCYMTDKGLVKDK